MSPLRTGLLLCLWLGVTPSALPASVEAPTWVTVGQGSYKRLFIPVYDARLEALQSQFDFPRTRPFALTFTYKLDLEAEDLIDNVFTQWKQQKLVVPETWHKRMQQVMPNIRKGDSLRLEVNEDDIAVLLHNGKPIANFNDPEFINAFVGIWLGDHSTHTTLRQQLLGSHP